MIPLPHVFLVRVQRSRFHEPSGQRPDLSGELDGNRADGRQRVRPVVESRATVDVSGSAVDPLSGAKITEFAESIVLVVALLRIRHDPAALVLDRLAKERADGG